MGHSTPERGTDRRPGAAVRPDADARPGGDAAGAAAELRIGVLGAAAIAPTALIRPARRTPRVTVTAVAARDRSRAEAFADKHGVPVVHDDYEALLVDPSVDAVYIPLPNGLHAEWTLKALDAGKHVLCEKPFTANRAEAERVADAADVALTERGLVVMEAFHYRYHPLAERMRAIVASGELGEIRRVEAQLCFPLPKFQDIRYNYGLAGGALMDAGCYALHAARLLAGGSEADVVSARARTLRQDPRIDRAMEAELAFADGATGLVRASLWSRRVLSMRARVVGTEAELSVFNFVAPQVFHRLTVRGRAGAAGGSGERVVRHERVDGPSSYACQLAAFAAAALDGAPVLTPARDAVVTMGLIDDIYRAAGLPLRGAAEDA